MPNAGAQTFVFVVSGANKVSVRQHRGIARDGVSICTDENCWCYGDKAIQMDEAQQVLEAEERRERAHADRLVTLRKVAQAAGYTLTEHGSMKRDIDLVAVPWVAEAIDPVRLIGMFMAATGGILTCLDCKPHGRIGVIMQGFGPTMWDISILAPRRD